MKSCSPNNHDEFDHLKIPLQTILQATNNFSEGNFWGGDAFDKLYKGQLLWSGELIEIRARRWLSKEIWNDKKEQQFWTEISMLSTLKHKNIVSLVGFCDENGEKIIITRRDTKGSLTHYLSDPMLLTWVRRLEISVGIARALSYIHYDEPRDFSVIHRWVCSDNVLLNDDWEPKLCAFDYSIKIEASQRHHSFHTNNLVYVKGYGDLTYIETKSVNHKSDMFSFGIVLFQLLCGRKSIIADNNNKHLASLAITHYREKKLDEIIDRDLWNQMDTQSFSMFAEIAYDCLNEEQSQRPNIDRIVMRLEKALELQLEHQKARLSLRNKEFADLKVPLENIRSATNNFDEEKILCENEFERRYKGQLLWSSEMIGIEARRWRFQEEQRFWMNISMLSSLKHKNIVSLLGFCDENDEKIFIIKHEIRGALTNYLSDSVLLTWVRRLEICVGIAHALSYIHYDEPRDFSVIHRKLCSANVVLNDDWEPKLYFFDFSMKIEASQRHHSFQTNKLVYETGYGDPTSIETKSVNHKSDIYSFGMVLFELLCGRKSISEQPDNKYLTPMAIFHYKEKILDDIIDPDLWKQMDQQSFNVFAETAYDCLNEERSRRPDIGEVVTRLEEALKLQLASESRPVRLSPIPEAMNKGKKEMAANYNILSKKKHDTTEIKLSLEDIEQHYGKTMKKAAEELGVSLSTLKRKHNKLCMSGWQGPDLPQRKAYDFSNNQSTESHTHEKDNGRIDDPSPVKRYDKTVIKAEYADDIIKLHLGISELTFVTVENEISKKLKLKHGTFKIKYLDEDEEWILMTSDQDMRDCMQNSRNVDGSAVRLRVLLHNQ